MPVIRSAGLLMFRRRDGAVEVLLAHPGGPFWSRRDEAAWTHPPFSADIAGGEMYGRGAVDMKGGIACFVAAVARHVEKHGGPKGSVSLLITGDEEGPAINGTVKLLEWAATKGEK